MSNIQETIGYLKEQANLTLLITAMQGSRVREALNIPNTSSQQILDKGFDDVQLSTALEASIELERLIRRGKSLSEAIDIMRHQGWLQRINEESV